MPSSNKVRKVTSENYPTDAGREGEAIFRRVYALAGSKLPIKRLWISSMEDAAIQQGFENLRDGAAYDNLFAASECRAKSDWLIGMNGTRAFTKKYGRKTDHWPCADPDASDAGRTAGQNPELCKGTLL